MSARPITLVLGTAAGAFLAAGLIPLATSPVAHADPDDVSVGADTDFIHATDPLLKMLGVTDVGAADPSDTYEAMVVTIPGTGITDVLTSGTDPSEALTSFGATATEALGKAGETVNTFTDTMMPSLDPLLSFTLPFTDPLAGLWDILVANDFFGL
jgi:hypothetical protein